MTPTPANSPPLEQAFLEAWQAASGTRLNGSNEAVERVRREAIERVDSGGLPRERDEAWKYTNIRRVIEAIGGSPAEPSTPDGAGKLAADCFTPGLDAHRVVVVDGRFDPDLSTSGEVENGVYVAGLAAAAADGIEAFNLHFGTARESTRDGLADLNSAFVRDGVFIHAAPGAVASRPVEIVYLSTGPVGTITHPRALYVAERAARVSVLERWVSLDGSASFTNALAECIVDTGAAIDHLRIVDESASAVHVHHLEARQVAGSRFTTNTITLGGGMVRNNAYFLPDGENCETHLYGFYLARGDMHVDNHTMVDHAHPDCFSNELYKGILDDRSTGVFNGKVLVRQDAQRINAYQSNKSIVLTGEARMYAKPELEIYADDVRCSHGATTGELDADALFYLRARGLTAAKARLLLLEAFAGDVIEQIGHEAVRTGIEARIAGLLES